MTLAFPKPIHVPTTYKNLHHKHSISKPEKTQESSYQNQELEPKTSENETLILATAAVLLLLLQVSASRADHPEPLLGAWKPIKNLSDLHVRGIAEFAVKTHNDEAKTGLVLKKVVKGETQVVAGTNYRLVIKVKDGTGTNSFEAIVWDKPWEHFRSLTSFKAVPAKV